MNYLRLIRFDLFFCVWICFFSLRWSGFFLLKFRERVGWLFFIGLFFNIFYLRSILWCLGSFLMMIIVQFVLIICRFINDLKRLILFLHVNVTFIKIFFYFTSLFYFPHVLNLLFLFFNLSLFLWDNILHLLLVILQRFHVIFLFHVVQFGILKTSDFFDNFPDFFCNCVRKSSLLIFVVLGSTPFIALFAFHLASFWV